jgi:ABC-type Zn uptake system ZnuABC Zn-binding protein ZnuA
MRIILKKIINGEFMNFKYKLRAILFTISLLLISCGVTEDEAPSLVEEASSTVIEKINVLATTPMIGDYIEEIGGDNINLTILMPLEANPHTYDPSPQDAAKISDADLIFYVGLKYEPAGLIKLLENSSSSEDVLVEIGPNIDPIEFKEDDHDEHDEDKDHEGHDDHDEHDEDKDHEGHDDHDEHDEDKDHEGHDHGLYDPHFWFDPIRVAMAAELIKDKLIEFDPSKKAEYESSADAYIKNLNDLDKSISELIESVPSKNRKLITTHESLGYLENKYGIQVLTTIIPSVDSANEISPSQLVNVIKLINDNDIKVIFVESEAPSVYSKTISQEANIDLVTGLWVETLKVNQSYSEFLMSNVELIVENLDHEDHDDHDDHEDHDEHDDHEGEK